jgi:hypothetical protein
MNDGMVAVVIVALSVAIGIFVGISHEAYGYGAFFLCVGVFTLFYGLIKMAARR